MAFKQSIAVALAAVLVALPTTGCTPTDVADSAEATGDTGIVDSVEPLATPRPQLPVSVESDDGATVEVTDVDRIVPLTGALSEIVFTLGLGDNVVAKDITATFEQAADLPVVTRGHDVSAENVLSVDPSLILASPSTGPDEAMKQIRAAGIPVVVVAGAAELSEVADTITTVAEILGVVDAGEELRDRTQERIAAVTGRVPESGSAPQVAFLYLRGSASVYLIGGTDSGAAGLIEAAGGIDAGKAAGFDGDFTPITSEAMAAAAPDAILVMTKGLESVDGIDGLLKLPGVAQTPAGQDRRVVSIDDGVMLNYGPRTDQVLASLIDQLYPKD